MTDTSLPVADLAAALQRGAAALGLELTAPQQRQLLDYLALLQKWNRVYNLTAVREPAEMLTHHLLDSLAVIVPLRRQLQRMAPADGRAFRLLDVGSGAGLPGVVIAICCPELAVTCVDTVAKKASFIQQVALSLKLPRLQGLHARVETLRGADYDVVCSRAFAALADFVSWSRAALAPAGCWMAMKGRHPADEIAALPSWAQVFHVEQLAIPGLAAERCLVWLRSQATAG